MRKLCKIIREVRKIWLYNCIMFSNIEFSPDHLLPPLIPLLPHPRWAQLPHMLPLQNFSPWICIMMFKSLSFFRNIERDAIRLDNESFFLFWMQRPKEKNRASEGRILVSHKCLVSFHMEKDPHNWIWHIISPLLRKYSQCSKNAKVRLNLAWGQKNCVMLRNSVSSQEISVQASGPITWECSSKFKMQVLPAELTEANLRDWRATLSWSEATKQ